MKRILFITCALLLGAVLGEPALQAVAASSPTPIAVDSFNRTLNDRWGNADKGGPYTVTGNPADYDVQNSAGQITVATLSPRNAYLPASQTLNANATVRFKTNKVSVGAAQLVSLLARRTSNGSSYLGRVRLLPGGRIQLEADTLIAGVTTRRGSALTSLTYRAGQYIRLRMMINGTNPTTLRLRAWADGQGEPTNWQLTVKDSTVGLQQAGAFGVQVRAALNTTNRPFILTFDDLQVSAIQAAPPPASPPSPTPPPPPTSPPPSTSSRIYWGALVNGEAPSPSHLAAGGVFDVFEQRAKKKMSILHWGQPWTMSHSYLSFQRSYFDAVRQRGSIPMLDWGSFNYGSGVIQPDFQLRDIYNGMYDGYITQWAKDAKAWGHPFFLRFDWEMNGNWQFPWSEQLNGNQKGDYVKMWRHVHDIFTRNGATNVTWVWCPNIAGSTTRDMRTLYPGDVYVDWICLDGYNKYNTWLRFDQVFAAKGINWLHNSYQEITTLAPSKPLMIGEFASLEAGDGGAKKAAWLRDMLLTQLPKYFPKIKAIVLFNWNDGSPLYTFPIESSNAARDAFAAGIGSSYYAANEFANQNTSPIPPLK
ncbi:MAG TPA: glycosyl hydrolase [Anaerolineae bacterium]|nr:glycosyl hydrolase [Anaerolineae bacterium]